MTASIKNSPKKTKVKLVGKFKDHRGLILNISNELFRSCVLITSKKNSIRANHYHKKDWHYCYILKGKIEYYSRKVGSNKKPKKEIFKKGDLFFTPPMVEHAMVFHKDTSFLTLGGNSRVQTEYEADLVRIELVSPENVFK